jgi:hypothetical protein
MRGADAFGVAWYRFRCTWGGRWPGYLSLVLLLGLLGGLAMGSVAAARRTQAAFPAYLATTNPSDLTVLTGLYGVAGSKGYDPAAIAKIAVPQPTVPALTVALIVVGALVTANVVALLPGAVAGRTPAAALLRAELRRYRHAAHGPVRRAIGLRTVRSGRPRRTRR